MRTYRRDNLPKSEVAVIKGIYAVGFPIIPAHWFIDIFTLDGELLKSTQVEVLPGWHELVIRDEDIGLGFVGPRNRIKFYKMSSNSRSWV